jgi:hypothetical protein
VWRQAADLRDRVLTDARSAIERAGCARPTFSGVPDSVDGAYVFRNGFSEALAIPAVAGGDARPDCAFTWSDSGFSRSR